MVLPPCLLLVVGNRVVHHPRRKLKVSTVDVVGMLRGARIHATLLIWLKSKPTVIQPLTIILALLPLVVV